jgi:hypothetical protein
MLNCEDELKLAKQRIKELEENEIAFPLRLYLALEEILDKDKGFYHLKNLELNVYDIEFEINKAISIDPKDLICITKPLNQNLKGNNGRKKMLFIKDDKNNVKAYLLNNNSFSFNKLQNQLDQFNYYLIIISKNTLANVKFYDIVKGNKLKINLEGELPGEIKRLSISNSKTHSTTIENFNKIKEAYNNRISLQKKVFGYKYLHGIDL